MLKSIEVFLYFPHILEATIIAMDIPPEYHYNGYYVKLYCPKEHKKFYRKIKKSRLLRVMYGKAV